MSCARTPSEVIDPQEKVTYAVWKAEKQESYAFPDASG